MSVLCSSEHQQACSNNMNVMRRPSSKPCVHCIWLKLKWNTQAEKYFSIRSVCIGHC